MNDILDHLKTVEPRSTADQGRTNAEEVYETTSLLATSAEPRLSGREKTT